MAKVNVIKNPSGEEIAVEIIADSIKNISEGMKRIRNSKLNDKALYLLIQHAAPCSPKPSLNEVKWIIAGIESLEKKYLKK